MPIIAGCCALVKGNHKMSRHTDFSRVPGQQADVGENCARLKRKFSFAVVLKIEYTYHTFS